MAETVNALYETELVYHPDQNSWDTTNDLELATLTWVHWWNNQRLHSALNYQTPNRARNTSQNQDLKVSAKPSTNQMTGCQAFWFVNLTMR
jgi:transposase InsO family protein